MPSTWSTSSTRTATSPSSSTTKTSRTGGTSTTTRTTASADTQPPFNIAAADRGVVYGVERQQLAFNEAMIAFLQQAVDTTVTPNVSWDHPDTQWNDRNQWAALYLELDNIGPLERELHQ